MDPRSPFLGKAHRLRRNWWRLAAAFVPAILGCGLMITPAPGPEWLLPILRLAAVLSIFAAPFILLYTWFASPKPRHEPGELTAGGDGIAWNGRPLLTRKAILAGFAIPHPDGAIVQLEQRFGRPVELLLPSAEDGHAVLDHLGLGTAQSVVSVPLRSLAAADWRRFIGPLLLLAFPLGVGLVSHLTLALAPLVTYAEAMLLALLAWTVVMFVKARATVGADGVLVSFLFRKRFYSYADLHHAVATYEGLKQVVLIFKDGSTVKLPIPRRWSDAQERTAAQRLSERILVAMNDQRAPPGEADLEQLARHGRPTREWIAHLHRLGAGANADHRRAPIPADRLWRIVEDATLEAGSRAAAAVALGGTKDEQTQARLRTLANATAAPKLRIALQTAAEASDEAAEAEVAAALEQAVKM